jgi:hypothetical protein
MVMYPLIRNARAGNFTTAQRVFTMARDAQRGRATALLTSVAEVTVAGTCRACSVVDGLGRGCDRLERRDQLVELVRGEHVVRRRGQLVGEGLDPLAGVPAGVGETTGGVQEAAVAQPVDDSGQLRLGEVVGPAELLRLHAEGESEQDVGLGAADAVGEEGGVVVVSAVLARERRRVPEPGHWFLGHVERPEPGVQRSAFGRCADGCPGGEVGGPDQAGGVGEFSERLPQCGGTEPFPTSL